MTLHVGVIGTGMIGRDHIRRLTRVLTGAEVVAVADTDVAQATTVAQALPDAEVFAAGEELVAADGVDAVIVTSGGPTHEGYVIASIAAGKPVFCEKPLATTPDATLRILAAEVELGRRLVQVGFMRRYDAAYRALKRIIDTGRIGAPLVYYSGHRNPRVPQSYTKDMAIVDTAVHDFDIARWLLDDEFTSIQVTAPRRNRHGGDLQDPLLMQLETTSGAVVHVETSVNAQYGYDIRGEVVGEEGTAALADRGLVELRHAGTVGAEVPVDWRERFAAAFDAEFQEWIQTTSSGQDANGPSSWDGYVATVVGDAGVRALYAGDRVAIELIDKPALYC